MSKRYIIQGVISVEKTTEKQALITIKPTADYIVKHKGDSFGVLLRKNEARLYSLKEQEKFKISSDLEKFALAAASKQSNVELEVKIKNKPKMCVKVLAIRLPAK